MNGNPIQAVIFDMDELLVDSRRLWKVAERELCAAAGVEWTPDLAMKYKGMNTVGVVETVLRVTGAPIPREQALALFVKTLVAEFGGEVEAMPGAVELVKKLGGKLPLAVASGSPKQAIDNAMSVLGLRDCFEALVSSDDVPKGKPCPDVFLAAAKALKMNPSRCLVFEDSFNGVRAAKSAGMHCFAVPSAQPEEIKKLADRVYGSLAEVRMEDVLPSL